MDFKAFWSSSMRPSHIRRIFLTRAGITKKPRFLLLWDVRWRSSKIPTFCRLKFDYDRNDKLLPVDVLSMCLSKIMFFPQLESRRLPVRSLGGGVWTLAPTVQGVTQSRIKDSWWGQKVVKQRILFALNKCLVENAPSWLAPHSSITNVGEANIIGQTLASTMAWRCCFLRPSLLEYHESLLTCVQIRVKLTCFCFVSVNATNLNEQPKKLSLPSLSRIAEAESLPE